MDPADAELARLSRVKRIHHAALPRFGEEIVRSFKQDVQRKQQKFGRIGESWGQLVPNRLIDHCELSSLARGTLTVLVDNSSHLYELKQLLLAGLSDQLLLASAGTGLRKINLKPGRMAEP